MKIEVYVDGNELPLNDFVSKILAGTITGAILSLKGVDEGWKKIGIEIRRE